MTVVLDGGDLIAFAILLASLLAIALSSRD